MANLAIIVPTRERADRFAAMVDAVQATATGSVEVVACVDADDPELELYRPIVRPVGRLLVGPRQSLSAWTNWAAQWVLNKANGAPPRHLASLGDDHLPRTPGWDVALAEACGGHGYAYGDDLAQGVNLPTAWVQTASTVRALGWMMLPSCGHLYVDNAILELGRAAGILRYCPDVVVEHMHPVVGKAEVDDSYRASNSRLQYRNDGLAFKAWVRDGLAADVARLLTVVSPA